MDTELFADKKQDEQEKVWQKISCRGCCKKKAPCWRRIGFWYKRIDGFLENKDLFDLANGTVGCKSYKGNSPFDLSLQVKSPHVGPAFPVFVHQGGD